MLIAAGTATALGVTGCGSGSDAKDASDLSGNRNGAMKDFGAGDQFKATKALTFTTLYNNNPGYPYKKNWLLWSELTKRTGVTLKPTVVPLSDYEQKRSVLIGAGDAPAIIPKTYFQQEVPFIASGAILPVSDFLDLMPNFKAKAAKWNMAADLDTLRQDDGRYYVLPGMHEEIWVDYSIAMRTDVLDDLGLEIPETWDDFHTVLKEIKKAHPGSYPMSDRWSIPTLGGPFLAMLGTAFKAGSGGGWTYYNATWVPDTKKFVFTGAMEEYRQMLAYAAKLVKEGLLDPESFTQQDDQAIAKFTSGKSFAICTNAQELVNSYRPAIEKSIKGARIVKIPVPIGPAGAIKRGTRLENGIMISKKVRDSKDFVALLQFIDWLEYSDAGQEFTKWGVKGLTYTRSGDKFTLADDVNIVGLNPDGSKDLQRDFGFFNGNWSYGGSTVLLESMFPKEELEFQKVMNARKSLPVDPPAPLTADEREQAALWESGLKDFVLQETVKFILGKRSLGEWDKYVSELRAKNSDAYIDLVNKAHQRFAEKHG
jgi:putative aldouronate transport system substrate-binding protein